MRAKTREQSGGTSESDPLYLEHSRSAPPSGGETEEAMAIEIIGIRFGSTSRTEAAIASYRWRNLSDGQVKTSDKPALVKWVDDGGMAYVGSGNNQVSVRVVKPADQQPYLRTYADGRWTNNLLSLPTF